MLKEWTDTKKELFNNVLKEIKYTNYTEITEDNYEDFLIDELYYFLEDLPSVYEHDYDLDDDVSSFYRVVKLPISGRFIQYISLYGHTDWGVDREQIISINDYDQIIEVFEKTVSTVIFE